MFVPGAYCSLFLTLTVSLTIIVSVGGQILKPAEKKAKYPYGGMNMGRPVTPPRKQKKKDGKMG